MKAADVARVAEQQAIFDWVEELAAQHGAVKTEFTPRTSTNPHVWSYVEGFYELSRAKQMMKSLLHPWYSTATVEAVLVENAAIANVAKNTTHYGPRIRFRVVMII